MTTTRYRGTLPLLNWLKKNDPNAVLAVARALIDQKPAAPAHADELDRETRPTVGELMRAASDAFRVYVRDGVRHVGNGYRRLAGKTYRDDEWQFLGDLTFYRGALKEWGVTKKGKKMRRMEDVRGNGKNKRSPAVYLKLRPTTPAPMDTIALERAPCRRPTDDGKPSVYYDPLPRDEAANRYGAEEARALLAALMPSAPPITKCPTVTAKGAHFFGGISRPKQGTNSGTVGVWDAPEKPKGEAREVLDEMAAGGSLKSLGVRLGYGPQYADRAAKRALLDTAKMLVAMNDNNGKTNIAA
ncbi:hypothetical protein [Mesorhizobium sp. B2-6-7]|uniref:hypothetical protein n=1 Tax=Mesorhizobium sp. B2-6-7 TaxID=2589910 RepID=UPI00112A0C52|nr:hypothetical protein [Mesorhizobium sp. B2-6-7]TPJ56753.1 hypothetical protein FJ462_32550 [Mesorhizobium sp. B2-6-7]